MNVFIFCCLAIMGIIFLCLLYRLVVHYQLDRINVKQTSILFQTKLNHFKQRELRKSFMYLFVGTMGLITVLSFAIIQLFQVDGEQALGIFCFEERAKVMMTRNGGKLVIVQPRAAQALIVPGKSHRFDDMQTKAGISAKTDIFGHPA